MTSKRNSRVLIDEEEPCAHEERRARSSCGSSSASSYHSRGNSRSSEKEDFMQVSKEAEEGQRPHNGVITAEDMDKSAEVDVKTKAMTPEIGQELDYPPIHVHGCPDNFGLVVPGVYRSSYPKPDNYRFLQGLRLKTVVTLVKKEEIDHDLAGFVSSNGINQIIFNMKGTKKEAIPDDTMNSILEVVLDHRNHPLMLHCNQGKHRTGCVVGVMRMAAGWAPQRAIDEYRVFAEPKIRDCDVEYLGNYQGASRFRECGAAMVRYSRFSQGQLRTFSRAIMVSGIVLFLWMLSGQRLRAATS